MKSCLLIAVLSLLFASLIAVDVAKAAPSLPVTKPPVTGPYPLTGPNQDFAATNGQWFLDIASGLEEYRTHEFHDNMIGFGGGSMSHLAISGIVTRVAHDALGTITNFDITATIYNDTAQDVTPWLAGTNSHGEVNQDPEKWYSGTLRDTKLTAEFAVSMLDPAFPQTWAGPYFPSVGSDIYALNEDQLAWYCWNMEQQGVDGGAGNYHVPTWDFGDIPQGRSATRVLMFAVPGGIPVADPRNTAIMFSKEQVLDILLNRTTSLKVSTWIDTLALDPGSPYPHIEGGESAKRSSDVSVFHNEDELDFGDAPYDGITHNYETLLIPTDGARHSIVAGVMMGSAIDAELDGQPFLGALLDDNTGIPDDEDGVVLATQLFPGQLAFVDVSVTTPGFVNMWVDLDQDGTWWQASEHVHVDTNVVVGVNRLTFAVPGSAVPGSIVYARVRFCTVPGITMTTGYAPDGEVEDYAWTISEREGAYDWGDAPDTYGTLATSTGAYHSLQNPGPWLGDINSAPDVETDGQPDANAVGDDWDGNDDERGVWIATGSSLPRGATTTYNMEVNGGGGVFQLWIDWDRDGTFADPGELVDNSYLTDGTYTRPITVPTNAVLGSTFARARISTSGGLAPSGGAADGEVEDHSLAITDGIWCNVQHPTATAAIVGTASEVIYGQCWWSGNTEGAGQAGGVAAEIGYGSDGSYAPSDGTWVWSSTTYNSGQTNANDEYMAQVTVGSTGVYDYAYRYSFNGGAWVYGDHNGDEYNATDAGHLVVTELPPFSITNVSMVATTDTVTVQWEAQDRVVYQMQYAADLADTNLVWSNVGSEVTGSMQTDTNAAPDFRFYRIRAPYTEGP